MFMHSQSHSDHQISPFHLVTFFGYCDYFGFVPKYKQYPIKIVPTYVFLILEKIDSLTLWAKHSILGRKSDVNGIKPTCRYAARSTVRVSDRRTRAGTQLEIRIARNK